MAAVYCGAVACLEGLQVLWCAVRLTAPSRIDLLIGGSGVRRCCQSRQQRSRRRALQHDRQHEMITHASLVHVAPAALEYKPEKRSAHFNECQVLHHKPRKAINTWARRPDTETREPMQAGGRHAVRHQANPNSSRSTSALHAGLFHTSAAASSGIRQTQRRQTKALNNSRYERAIPSWDRMKS